MNRSAAALLVILIIVGAGIGLYILYQPSIPEPETELVETPSSDVGKTIIYELGPGETYEEEFIELFTTGTVPDMKGWILTTYDDDRYILPALTGSSDYLYIQIFSGSGEDELDMSDNQVTLYTALNITVLDEDGDEVGLHDEDGMLVDFVMYDGGNGDPIIGDWDEMDEGPDSPSADMSVSFFWDDTSTGEWRETPRTPGEPNALLFETSGFDSDIELLIINGVREEIESDGIDDDLGQLTEANLTVTAGPGVNASTLDLVREHLNFSLNLYHEAGYPDPLTNAAGRIRVRVLNDTSSESTGGTSADGSIVLRVGRNATKEELKVVGEHELMHTIHFRPFNDTNNNTYRHLWFFSRWFVEGQAEFWGLSSMLKNYPHMNMTTWMRMAQRIGSLNWFDHYRDINGTGPFGRWFGSWDNYMGAFLFTKWLNETYGPDTLFEIFNATRYYGAGHPDNVSPEEAFENVVGTTLLEAMARFWAWLMTDATRANGVPAYTPHIHLNYTDTSIGDNTTVRGGGAAVIEEVEVNGESPFTIRLNYSNPAATWVASVVIFYDDGTNETVLVEFNSTTRIGEIHIEPYSERKITRILVIKGHLSATSQRIQTRLIPDHDEVEGMTYNGEQVNDTVELEGLESAYEIIDVNNTQAFSVFLNWTENTHWNFTIIRYWSDGTNDTFHVQYGNETWRGYILDPDAGPTTVTRLVIIKQNLNETSANITMTVTPAGETPNNAIDPMIPDIPEWWWWPPRPWGQNGGFLASYAYLNSSTGYDFLAEVTGDYTGLVLAANLSVVLEFTLTPSTPFFQMLGPDTGIYYFVLTSGVAPGFYVEAKPYAWP